MTDNLFSHAEIALTFDQLICRQSVSDLQELSNRLKLVEGIVSIETRLGGVIVSFHSRIAPQTILRRMAAALRGSGGSARSESTHTNPLDSVDPNPRSSGISVLVASLQTSKAAPAKSAMSVRISQMFYGTMAAGAFVMACIGLVVPGIPTVPFVILTAVLAAKGSPAFHRWLLRNRVFGPMIHDWNTYHAIRPSARNQAVVLTIIIICVTLAVSPGSPILYTVVAVMAVFSLTVIFLLPVISADDADEHQTPNPHGLKVIAVA